MEKSPTFQLLVTLALIITVLQFYKIDFRYQYDQSKIDPDKSIENYFRVENIKQLIENEKENGQNCIRPTHLDHWKLGVHLSVVVCVDRAEESIVLLKSAALFTKKPWVVHIFTEFHLQSYFRQKLDYWPAEYKSKILYFIYNITWPNNNKEEWKKLFKPCASQRLFIPSVLTDVDSLLYVDTDILFLRPLEYIWSFFDKFNSTQLAALAPEHEDRGVGWYSRFARHPYYGTLGVNSGVLLMNLRRLRNTTWIDTLQSLYQEYKYGDQDLINVYLHLHPDQLYTYSCEWNYRPDHCMNKSYCKDIGVNGISVLHGGRREMHTQRQPAFKAVYTAFKEHQFSDSIKDVLLKNIKHNLAKTSNTTCGQIGTRAYTKHIEEFVLNQKSKS